MNAIRTRIVTALRREIASADRTYLLALRRENLPNVPAPRGVDTETLRAAMLAEVDRCELEAAQ